MKLGFVYQQTEIGEFEDTPIWLVDRFEVRMLMQYIWCYRIHPILLLVCVSKPTLNLAELPVEAIFDLLN